MITIVAVFYFYFGWQQTKHKLGHAPLLASGNLTCAEYDTSLASENLIRGIYREV